MPDTYTPATSEAEAFRWSTLAQALPPALAMYVRDDTEIITDLTAVLRSPMDPHLRMQIERIRDKYMREAEYLTAVLYGRISKNAKIERA